MAAFALRKVFYQHCQSSAKYAAVLLETFWGGSSCSLALISINLVIFLFWHSKALDSLSCPPEKCLPLHRLSGLVGRRVDAVIRKMGLKSAFIKNHPPLSCQRDQAANEHIQQECCWHLLQKWYVRGAQGFNLVINTWQWYVGLLVGCCLCGFGRAELLKMTMSR